MAYNDPYGLGYPMAGSSLPDIAEKYRKGVSNVVDWGYDFKKRVRDDFLADQFVPANMAYAQRQFLQNQLGNQVTQDRWDDLANYAASTIGKNRIEAGTAAMQASDNRQVYEDTRQQQADIARNKAAAGLSESQQKVQQAGNAVQETDAKTVYGQLGAKHSSAANNYDRANAILAEVQSDPSLRGNPALVKMALDEVQKQAAILQSQGASHGLPDAAAAGSERTGSAVTLKKGPDGKLVPSYRGQAGTPIDAAAETQRKVISDRAAALEKVAEAWRKQADATEDPEQTKQFLGNATEALKEAHRLRSGSMSPTERMDGAAAVVGVPGAKQPAPMQPAPAQPAPTAPPSSGMAPPGYRYGLDGKLYPLPNARPAPQPAPATAPSPYGALPRQPPRSSLPTISRMAPYLPYSYSGG